MLVLTMDQLHYILLLIMDTLKLSNSIIQWDIFVDFQPMWVFHLAQIEMEKAYLNILQMFATRVTKHTRFTIRDEERSKKLKKRPGLTTLK